MNNSKIKNSFKSLVPSYIIAFVVSFMMYIYEPILTYSSNIDDFWFDFDLMLPNVILYATVMFLIISVGYTIIYVLEKMIFKKEKIYKGILIISWIIFISTYIQGNYLTGSLPALDGTTINWNNFTTQNIITIVIFVILVLMQIILLKKLKTKKTIKINTFLTIAVFGMLLASFTSVLCTPNLYKKKTISVATNKNINSVSSNKNFYIFLVDAVDSIEFNSVLKNSPEYSDTFENFTYFPDTVSGYTFTRDSIPFILTGKWNKNEKEFTEYYNDAFKESKFLKLLEEQDYSMNYYEIDLYCNKENSQRFDNILIDNGQISTKSFFKQLSKYVLFKYLPYPLKQYSKIESVDFKYCRTCEEESIEYYAWNDYSNYYRYANENVDLIDDKKMFQFIHTEGGHVPFNYDEELNEIPETQGTYQMKLKSTIKMIDEFIKRLKENNVYDNSVIIVMADHGYGVETGWRQNPILYIKGVNERHKMETSEIPVSYEDLMNAYEQLLEDKKSNELFRNIDKNRTRIFINNLFKAEDNMKEYEVNGKAWDSTQIKETGVEYSR